MRKPTFLHLNYSALYNVSGGQGGLPNAATYTVTFVDWDGAVFNMQHVYPGYPTPIPAIPTRSGYRFIGWDVALDSITSTMAVWAQYEIALDLVSATIPAALYVPEAAANQALLAANAVETSPGVYDVTVTASGFLAPYDDGNATHEWAAVLLTLNRSLEGVSYNGGAPWTDSDFDPADIFGRDSLLVSIPTDTANLSSTFTLSDGTTTLTFNVVFAP